VSSLLRRIKESLSATWEKYKLKRTIRGAGATAPGVVLATLRASGRKELTEVVAKALENSPKPTIGWLLIYMGVEPTSTEGRAAIAAVEEWCHDYARYLQLVDTYGLEYVLNSPDLKPLLEKVQNPPRFFDRFMTLFARYRKRSPARLFTATLSILEKISQDLSIDLPTLLELVMLLEKNNQKLLREVLRNVGIPEEAIPAIEVVLELARAVAFGRLLTAMNLLTSPSTREILEKALGEGTVKYIGEVIRGLTNYVVEKVKFRKGEVRLPSPESFPSRLETHPELPYVVKV